MAPTWQQIYEGETDINSPVGQSLMDKVRENLDYLKDREFDAAFLYGTRLEGSPGATAYDEIIDPVSSHDWRDRYMRVLGVAYSGSDAQMAPFQPGGSSDDQIGSPYNPTPIYGHFDGWIYTQNGGASRATNPFLNTTFTGPPLVDFYVWVDGSGNLQLGITTAASGGNRSLGWDFMIYFSAKLGVY
jgi:hypothetical protein